VQEVVVLKEPLVIKVHKVPKEHQVAGEGVLD
jgi:hypothetical protein